MDFAAILAEAAQPTAISWPLIWCIGLWLAFLGGCVGSFLNVVIYRVPAGKSIVTPGSHCPVCNHAIRWYDNVPIVSWLVLRARCRDCGTAIPVRYPLVEALVALLFVGVAVAQLADAGGDLVAILNEPREFVRVLVAYAYHVVLLVTLLAAAFICFDGHGVSWKVMAPALAVGIAVPPFFPSLHAMPLWPADSLASVQWGWLWGLAASVAGGAAGMLVAVLALPVVVPRSGERRQPGAWTSIALTTTAVGACVGWQAAFAIGGTSAVVFLLLTIAGRWLPPLQRVPWTGVLFAATTAWVGTGGVLFEPLLQLPWLLVKVIAYLGVVVLTASALTRTLSAKPRSSDAA